MEQEGIIKFNIKKIINTKMISSSKIKKINYWRNLLYKHQLVGFDKLQNVGYGNLSYKISNSNNFIITGSQTGKQKHLTGKHYTEVFDFNLQEQWLSYKGPISASSESLTHAAIYLSEEKIKYVFHVHHHKLWKYLIKENYPYTSTSVVYGTQEMATEVLNIIKLTKSKNGIIVMKGHLDGIISYGESDEITGIQLIQLLKLIN